MVEHKQVRESDIVASVISFSAEMGFPGLPGAYAFADAAANGAAGAEANEEEAAAPLTAPSSRC